MLKTIFYKNSLNETILYESLSNIGEPETRRIAEVIANQLLKVYPSMVYEIVDASEPEERNVEKC